MKKLRIYFWILAAMATAVFLGLLVGSPNSPLRTTEAGKSGLIPVSEDVFGGPFSLTDQNGKTVTDKDFGGKYRLIYFGFTSCPAICPTELAKITSALNKLGAKSENIAPIFITVDPERDTVAALKNYVTLFHPSLTGLTGTPEDIARVTKAYKIYAAKVDDPSLSEYTMDHSSFIYFIGPDGRLLHIFHIKDDADVMTDVIGKWMSQ